MILHYSFDVDAVTDTSQKKGGETYTTNTSETLFITIQEVPGVEKMTRDRVEQVLLIGFTLSAQFFFSHRDIKLGLILSGISQFFWMRSAYKSYKDAQQWGILVNTICCVAITIYGVYNNFSSSDIKEAIETLKKTILKI